ncbi:unnamed protein product, partial [Arctia plantaginis]
MNYKCGACAELLTDGVHCTVCKQQLHFQCTGITEAGYRKLGDRKLTWRCGKCKQTTPTQPLSPRIEPESLIMRELIMRDLSLMAINDKLAPLECLKDEVVALRNEFEELKGSFNDTNKELREFSARFTDIEHRLLQVEKAQKQVDSMQNRLDKLEDETNA